MAQVDGSGVAADTPTGSISPTPPTLSLKNPSTTKKSKVVAAGKGQRVGITRRRPVRIKNSVEAIGRDIGRVRDLALTRQWSVDPANIEHVRRVVSIVGADDEIPGPVSRRCRSATRKNCRRLLRS